MKRFLLFLFSLLIGAALFIWILETVGWSEIKNAFLSFSGWQGLVILALTVVMILVSTWRWQEVLSGVGVKLPFFYLTKIYLAGFSILFFAPIIIFGGEIFRAYVLKERNSLTWPKSMASVIIDRILEWTVNLVVVFFGALIFLLISGLPSLKLLFGFGAGFLLLAIGIGFFYFKSLKKESIFRFFVRNGNHPHEIEKEIFSFFKLRRFRTWKVFLISLIRTTAMYLRAWLLVLFLGKSIGALAALSILSFNYLALAIPIPAALGSHEAIQAFAFNALGLGASTATAFTMIIRGAELAVALLGVLLLLRLGLSLFKNTLFKKIEKLAELS